MPFCPECGSEVEPDDVHCYNCGRNLEDGPPNAGSGQQQEDEWGSSWDQTGQEAGSTSPGQQTQSAPTGQRTQSAGQPTQSATPGDGTGDERVPEKGRRRVEDGKVDYAIYFPITDGYEPVGLGGVAVFAASFLFIPIFTVYGYVYRLIGAAARGDEIQPEFDELVEMTKQGFFYFLLLFAYMLGAAVLVGGPVAVGLALESPAVAIFGAVVGGLAVSYVGPAVFVLYPVTGSFSAALSPARIQQFAFNSTYFVSYLLFLALAFAFNLALVVGTFVLAITIIGILLVFPLLYLVQAYGLYAAGSYWGATYYELSQDGTVPPAGETDGDQPSHQPGAGTEYY